MTYVSWFEEVEDKPCVPKTRFDVAYGGTSLLTVELKHCLKLLNNPLCDQKAETN